MNAITTSRGLRLGGVATPIASACLAALALAGHASADTLKVLTTGAYKPIVQALAPAYEARSGHKLEIVNDTAGAVARRVSAGEAFDVLVLTPAALQPLAAAGRVREGTTVPLARVGIGVAVKAGAAAPPMATVEDFKLVVRAARKLAYIDPAAGGSSGIYLDGLFQRLGLAEVVKPKAVLVPGGLVAEKLVSGEADLAIHQISEILPVAGAQLVGPLPAEIQNFTTYVGALHPAAHRDAAALLSLLAGAEGAEVLRAKGMQPAR